MNRLQYETSPYLLQHAHNPVDWYAWKPEAFERARAEDKPVLVSIGYSTCHWCHVMERESFEDPDVAAMMNDYYINIKVDREERPDVDAIYMEACQLITGQGGWPLNCFLTPDGRPFYAGTYFPPRPAYGRASWTQVLRHLNEIWKNERSKILEQADRLTAHIRRNDDVFLNLPAESLPAQPAFAPAMSAHQEVQTLENVYYSLREHFDRLEGGFGGAPKFPAAMSLQFLLHYSAYVPHEEAVEHVKLSLDKMIHGGIYDQLGGGFARYSTDREWLAPHFEKMLYDNALLVITLAETYARTGEQRYRETIEETLEFIQREMTHPEGGFYSALDADSEGEEGKFYVWTKTEIEALLGEEATLFNRFYDVTEEGNWERHTILRRLQSFEQFAEANKMELNELKNRLSAAREKLLVARAGRVRPGLDDKVLLSWNALAVSAYAAAFKALGKEEYRIAALRNLDFLLRNMQTDDGRLLHTWKDGKAQYDGFLEDYAYVIAALLDVWEITFQYNYLVQAEKYTNFVLSYFNDPATDLFFFTAEGQADILMRKKDLYDNATPSGNSTMVLNLQRQALLLDRRDWQEKAGRMLEKMRPTLERYAQSFSRWSVGLLRHIHPPHEIAVIGEDALEKALAVQRHFLPNYVIAAAGQPMEQLALMAGKSGGNPSLIYVCRDFACRQPVLTLEEFRALTDAPVPPIN